MNGAGFFVDIPDIDDNRRISDENSNLRACFCRITPDWNQKKAVVSG